MSFQFFNPGGGAIYHLRALRNSKKNWANFRTHVTHWLKGWTPPVKNLLIVGPSGGYSFDSLAIEKFSNIVAIDTDTLAPFFFKRNHPSLKVTFKNQCVFKFFLDASFDSKKISAQLFSGESFAILFSNFLGQVEIIYPKASSLGGVKQAEWMGRLKEMLVTLPWATYHDRVSSNLKPQNKEPLDFERRPSVRDLLTKIYSDSEKGEVTDHAVDDLFLKESGPFRYLIWNLVPNQKIHIIECFQAR